MELILHSSLLFNRSVHMYKVFGTPCIAVLNTSELFAKYLYEKNMDV